MRTTRTLTALALAGALVGTLAACGDNDPDTGMDDGGIPVGSTPSTAAGESGAPTAAADASPTGAAPSTAPSTTASAAVPSAAPAVTTTTAAGATTAPRPASPVGSPTG